MKRLPAGAFAALVVATVAAFFVTQHLKVENPLYNGSPRADPPAINPVSGRRCTNLVGRRVSFRRSRLGFFLQARSDTAAVYIVDSDGDIVATVSSGRYMVRDHYSFFTWNGREYGGRAAPDGTYYFKLVVPSEDRSFTLTTTPVQVITSRPRPRVTQVGLAGSITAKPRAATPIVSPPGTPVAIRYVRGAYRSAFIQIYRTDLPGRPRLVKSFRVAPRRGRAVWNGLIAGRPAPAGTYQVGIFVTDQACNPGRFPVVVPPVAGSTPHTGVTVRYLAVQPPLTPVAAGSSATVFVDSRRHPYTWTLYRSDLRRRVGHGSVGAARAGGGAGVSLSVPIPPLGAGLYKLAVRSGANRTVVPLIASAGGRRAAAHVLVVLPALSWQGQNPVDDDGGGLPSTLAAGAQIDLQRPLVDGLPAAFGDESALLAYLDRRHLAYQLTSDLALAEGVGPPLSGHTGAVLDGPMTWLPAGLVTALHAFAAGGGRVLSLGVHSLEATAALHTVTSAGVGRLVAGPPSSAHAVDPFGADHGSVAPVGGQLITVISDPLRLFAATSGAFSGFASAQTITPPNGVPASLAGTTNGTPSITGFRLGHGTVVEVGLPGFAARLSADFDAQQLLQRAWQLLSS